MQVFDSYIDAGQELSRRDRERFYTAVLEYLAYGAEPELAGPAKAVFTAILPSLRETRVRTEAGRKGGRPRKDRTGGGAETETAENRKPKTGKTENQNGGNGETKNADSGKPNSNSKGNKEKDVPKGTSKEKAAGKPERHRYGEFSNVLLSDSELEQLKARFPGDWQRRIDMLSGYIGSRGDKYKSHYITILNWARNEQPGEVRDERFRKYD